MFALITLIRNKIDMNKLMMIILPIGTTISGTLFITVAIIIGGIEAGAFIELFISVVLTAAVINTILGFALFKIVERTAAATGAYLVNK